MKPTNQLTSGASFHDDIFTATVKELREILGPPSKSENKGKDKANFIWNLETESGRPFTVYDWKLYRVIDENEVIDWNVGGFRGADTMIGAEEIKNALENLD